MTSRRLRPGAIALAVGLFVAIQVAGPTTARAATALTTGSTLTLDASPSTAKVGDQIVLSGSLTFADSSSSAGQTITLTREDAAGTGQVGDATTASSPDGSYSLADTAPLEGTLTYHAWFAGDATYDPAQASDTVSVSKKASHVSLVVSAHAVTFGASVHLTAHLGRGTDSRILAIYAKPDGESEKLIREAKAGRHRDLHATYTPSKDTTFIARYHGDVAHRAAHDVAVTRVAVIVRAHMLKGSMSGRVHVYRHGEPASCYVRVVPNHKGFAVRATLQMFTSGRWRKSASKSFRLNASSITGFRIRGTRNVNFRVHVALSTHHDHLGGTSPWLYLRFL